MNGAKFNAMVDSHALIPAAGGTEQSVYNVGLFTDVDLKQFAKTEPTHQFVELATLH